MFGARHVVCNGFLELFFFKNSCLLRLKTPLLSAVKLNQNSEVAGRKTENSELMLKRSVELRWKCRIW